MKRIRAFILSAKQHFQHFRFNSILVRNFVTSTLFIILSISICVSYYYVNMQRLVEDEVKAMSSQTLEDHAKTMDSSLRDILNMALNISGREEINFYAYMNAKEIASHYTLTNFYNDLSTLISLQSCTDSIYIYYDSSQLVMYNEQITTTDKMPDTSWLQAYQDMDQKRFQIQFRKKNDFYPYYLSIIYPFFSPVSKEKLGAVIVNINLEKWGSTAINGESDLLFCLDKNQNMYYCSDYSLLDAQNTAPDYLNFLTDMPDNFSTIIEINQEKTIVISRKSTAGTWNYVSLTSLSHYQNRIRSYNNTTIFLLLIGIFSCLIISMIMTIKTSKPIMSIMQMLNTDGVLELLQANETPNELSYIKNQILHSRNSSLQLQHELDRQLKQLNSAQLNALQSQIDPHFLYNTLDTINWMSLRRLNGKNDISDMISDLAQLLYISIQNDSYLVPVREEIAHVKIYLRILEKRYQERLKILWDVDDQLLDCEILKLSIQPIVENAIIHGLRPKRYKGTILIVGKIKGNTAEISVTDNGIGMSEQDILTLNQKLKESSEDNNDHIGIYNVNNRLILLFGSSFGIFVSKPENLESGLTVSLRFPIHISQND